MCPYAELRHANLREISREPAGQGKNKNYMLCMKICLTFTTLKYFCIYNHGDQRVFVFEMIINVLVSSFRFI